MDGRHLSVLIICILFLPSLLPMVSTGKDMVSATGTTTSRDGQKDLAPSPSTASRSNLETSAGGGSWTEYFDDATAAALNRTRVIDGKMQLDTDFTSLTKWVNDPMILPSPGHFDSGGTRMNTMLYENGIFKLWYSGTDGTHWRIGYATSMDGINWTKQNGGNPVLGLGGANAWDDNHVAIPYVINDGGTYKMWYSGHGGANWAVGYATSVDGISWNKYANNPIINIKAGTFYSVQVYPNTIIKENGKYKMWLTGANGAGNLVNRIGYATSNDGTAWNVNANTVLAVGAGGSFDSTANEAANVWKAGNRYFMTYCGYDGANMEIGAAESLDGINWNKMNNAAPIIKNGGGGSWDSTYEIETSRVQLGYRTYFLYGAYGNIWQIGLALADSYFTEGYAYSEMINLPKGMVWDNLSLQKFEPAGTSIKISVVDPSTNSSLVGFDNRTSSDLNLSSINSSAHNSLRLIAYFKGTASKTPSLYMWGVSWRNMTTWRDTFLGSSKISSMDGSKVRLWNGTIVLDVDPLTWTKDASNPVLTNGTGAKWDNTRVWDPSFLSKDGTNYLYYTGGTAPTEKIGYATAADLKTFTKYASNPVLASSVGKFDSMGVRDPDVQYTDSTLKMYYGGRGASTGINFAVSADMNTWSKYPAGPGFTPSAAGWDKGQVRDPSVLRVNNTWYMWYAANSTAFEMWRIGVATSHDNGFFWSRPANNEVMDVGAGNKFDDMNLQAPAVIFDKDRYLMYYVGTDVTFGTGQIGVASSPDGITWTRMNGGNAVLSPGSGWDASHMESVYVAIVNGSYEMYYTASGAGGNMQIGHATAAHYSGATVVSSTIQLPGNGLWNSVHINKTEPSGTYVNVSVLNATTGTPIPGFVDLTGKDINISTLGFGTKIKLKATFSGDGKSTPALYDWAVNWTIAKVEQKTLIPDKSFPEEGTALNLYDLSQYFTHKRFANTSLNYTISSSTDTVHVLARIEADGHHMSFQAPTVNWTGNAKYTIKVTDGYMNLTSNQFTVTVLNVNDPPVWLKIPDKHIVEDIPVDNLVDLVNYAVDSDTALKDLVFSFVNYDPVNMTITLDANNNLDVAPGNNYTGTVKVAVTVSDGQYKANSSFNIIVDPVNDAPVWTPFGPIQFPEDTPQIDIINLETMVKDAETPQADLTYTVSSDPSKVAATISAAHKLSLYPAANYTGTTNLVCNVSDGQYTVPLTVVVIVTPVNDAPAWLPMPQFSFPEDSTGGHNLLELEDYAVDAETPSKDLTYNVETVSVPSAAVTIGADHHLSVSTVQYYRGTIIIEVSVSDGLLRAMTNITVVVTPVNHAPTITSTPFTVATAGQLYQYQVVAMDIEGDPLSYSLTTFISGMTIDAATGLISWIPADTQTGSYEVKLQVSDGLALATQDYFIDVSPKATPTNNPPVITSEPPTEAVIGAPYTYSVLATDPDKDPLTYSLTTRPTGMIISSTTGVVQWAPLTGMDGQHPVVIMVSDGKAQVTQSFVVTVYPKGTVINHPPEIISIPLARAIAGTSYTYKIIATDADGDTLHYFLSLGPKNMTVDANSGLVQWAPDALDLGMHNVILRVSDGRANVSQTFTIAVSLANHAPSMTSSPVTKATVGRPYTYQLSASDPDSGDKLLYGLKSGPAGMSVDPKTGLITWMPTKKGSETVTVYVSDGNVQYNQTFAIKVTTKSKTGLGLANFPWWIIVVLVIVIVVILAVVLSRRRQNEAAMHEEPPRTHPKAYHPPSPPRARAPPVVRPTTSAPPVMRPPVAAPPVKHEEIMEPDEPEEGPIAPKGTMEPSRKQALPVQEAPTVVASTKDILDEILGKAPPLKEEEPPRPPAPETKEIPKATAKPVDIKTKTVVIEEKTYTQEQILHSLTSLPRGLPSTLWGMDMDELASEIMIADYVYNKSGDVIVKIGKKWYFGDPKELGTYMQQDKSHQ